MTTLPDQYVIEKFCQYTGYPKFNKRSNVWTGGCPICREGKSWGKKRRLYYKLDKNYIFCFNCGWKGGTVEYIKHVTGMSYTDILNESNNYNTNNVQVILDDKLPEKTPDIPSLPEDSINLFDSLQTDFWVKRDNKSVIDGINFIKRRKLDVAINKPRSIWLSLSDYVHKNRIILPFYSTEGKIIFYQSRSLYNTTNKLPKYLSKSGGDKSIFNINQIDSSIDNIYIFEGPIDSCFIKNGIAIAGITATSGDDMNQQQLKQMQDLKLYNKIWVLDSQWTDSTSYSKTHKLIDEGHQVFIWPESIGKQFKDINDVCIHVNKPGLGHKFIDKHSYTGLKAKMVMKSITKPA